MRFLVLVLGTALLTGSLSLAKEDRKPTAYKKLKNLFQSTHTPASFDDFEVLGSPPKHKCEFVAEGTQYDLGTLNFFKIEGFTSLGAPATATIPAKPGHPGHGPLFPAVDPVPEIPGTPGTSGTRGTIIGFSGKPVDQIDPKKEENVTALITFDDHSLVETFFANVWDSSESVSHAKSTWTIAFRKKDQLVAFMMGRARSGYSYYGYCYPIQGN